MVKGRVLQASINIVYIIENNISVAVHQACYGVVQQFPAIVAGPKACVCVYCAHWVWGLYDN